MRPYGIAVAACLGMVSVAHAQRRPSPPAPPPATRPAGPRRLPPVVIERHSARSIVALTGWLDGPVAIDGGGRVTYLSDDGVLGQLAPDGNLRWAFLVAPAAGPASVGPDGQVYAAGRDRKLYALDGDGRLLWMRGLAGRPVRGVSVASATIAVALDSGVLETWRSNGERIGRVRLGAVPAAAPVFLDDRRIVVPMRSGELVASGPRGVLWRTRLSRLPIAPLAIAADGSMVAAAGDGMVARVTADGRVVWRMDAGAPVVRSPAIGIDGTVYLAVGDTLVALADDGQSRWRTGAGGQIVAGPLIADDGAIYAATVSRRSSGGGSLVVFVPDGSVERELALPAVPTRGLALDAGMLWLALDDLSLRRYQVPQRGLARTAWAKARGDRENTGAASPTGR